MYLECVCELMPPHLAIYLDAPIEAVRERIIKRNDVSNFSFVGTRKFPVVRWVMVRLCKI